LNPKPFHGKPTAHRGIFRLFGLALALASASCVTVKPQERAILADPSMQFESDPQATQVRHAIENREGSYGGASVSGGGCGCN
jgi:hypothetical protein